MSVNNPKRVIYLPIAFAVVLAAGILLGNRLTMVTSSKTGNVFMVNPEKHDKINDIINYVNQDYVDSVSREDLVNNAIDGILENLDPHSQYIPAEDFHEFNDDLEGNFEGIGIQFRIERDTIMVQQVIPGGPTPAAGELTVNFPEQVEGLHGRSLSLIISQKSYQKIVLKGRISEVGRDP